MHHGGRDGGRLVRVGVGVRVGVRVRVRVRVRIRVRVRVRVRVTVRVGVRVRARVGVRVRVRGHRASECEDPVRRSTAWPAHPWPSHRRHPGEAGEGDDDGAGRGPG